MKVWARYHPAAAQFASSEPALLLEGSWPGTASPAARWSLDRTIDARSAWIDRAAAELAEGFVAIATHDRHLTELAWLNVVKLRYVLVKLLRIVAFLPRIMAVDGRPERWSCSLAAKRRAVRGIHRRASAAATVTSNTLAD